MNQAEVLCHSSGLRNSTYFAEAIKAKEDSLEHHGVLGQKWGIRRYQNKDGSLTAEGKKRASEGAEGVSKVLKKGQADARNTRMFGKVKGLGAQAALTIGTAAAGGALGSTTGPAGTIAGVTTGGLAGAAAGRAANEIIKMHANEKAAALSQEYQLLGQKMMEEYGKQKVSEITSNNKSENQSAERGTSESAKNFDKYVKENGGKLTWANFPSHDRDGVPTYNWTEKQKQKYMDEYNSQKH